MVDSGAGGSIQIDTHVGRAGDRQERVAARDRSDVGSTDAKAKFAAARTQLLPDAPVRAEAGDDGGGDRRHARR